MSSHRAASHLAVLLLLGLGSCQPVTPCAGESCTNAGLCIVLSGQPRCLCDDGFRAEGLQCLPMESCRAHARRACYEGNVFWFDSCMRLEDLAEACDDRLCAGGVCITRLCTPGDRRCTSADDIERCDIEGASWQIEASCDAATQSCWQGGCCVRHDTRRCLEGDVHWYNSCDQPEDLAEACAAGSTTCVDGFCRTTTELSVTAELLPQEGVAGIRRVNFALPLPAGQLLDDTKIAVYADAQELPAYRRGLARHDDGSWRSVQLQVQVDVDVVAQLDIHPGQDPAASTLPPVAVETTLRTPDGETGPAVWVLLPADWMVASGILGPVQTEADVEGGELDAWDAICLYATFDTEHFIDRINQEGAWSHDRAAIMYLAHVRRGDLTTLSSAFREAHMYRNGLTGQGSATRIGIPGRLSDVTYHYSQGLALHFLLTGDDRFREAAEDVALRVSDLWSSPGYDGGQAPAEDRWTELDAGFALLAYLWAGLVSDDLQLDLHALADVAVQEYLDVIDTYPEEYEDEQARCFAHHDSYEELPSCDCMVCNLPASAVLADGLAAYTRLRPGVQATAVSEALVKLGRVVATVGRAADGKPHLAVGLANDYILEDLGEEHWGEAAYIVGLAWHLGGRVEPELRSAALSLLQGLRSRGSASTIASFNRQCRSAPLLSGYLE